jgi:hypothetical protein
MISTWTLLMDALWRGPPPFGEWLKLICADDIVVESFRFLGLMIDSFRLERQKTPFGRLN